MASLRVAKSRLPAVCNFFAMPATRYWAEWLPAELSEEIVREEPKRFKTLVRGITTACKEAQHGDAASWAAVLPWIDPTSRSIQAHMT